MRMRKVEGNHVVDAPDQRIGAFCADVFRPGEAGAREYRRDAAQHLGAALASGLPFRARQVTLEERLDGCPRRRGIRQRCVRRGRRLACFEKHNKRTTGFQQVEDPGYEPLVVHPVKRTSKRRDAEWTEIPPQLFGANVYPSRMRDTLFPRAAPGLGEHVRVDVHANDFVEEVSEAERHNPRAAPCIEQTAAPVEPERARKRVREACCVGKAATRVIGNSATEGQRGLIIRHAPM